MVDIVGSSDRKNVINKNGHYTTYIYAENYHKNACEPAFSHRFGS